MEQVFAGDSFDCGGNYGRRFGSPFLCLFHPPLQHRLDFLRTLRRDVQLLKPIFGQ